MRELILQAAGHDDAAARIDRRLAKIERLLSGVQIGQASEPEPEEDPELASIIDSMPWEKKGGV